MDPNLAFVFRARSVQRLVGDLCTNLRSSCHFIISSACYDNCLTHFDTFQEAIFDEVTICLTHTDDIGKCISVCF